MYFQICSELVSKIFLKKHQNYMSNFYYFMINVKKSY